MKIDALSIITFPSTPASRPWFIDEDCYNADSDCEYITNITARRHIGNESNINTSIGLSPAYSISTTDIAISNNG